MSSSEFESTFDHAASLVRIWCKGRAGLEQILEAIKQRLRRGTSDPRVDRHLFFEPWIDAQQLGVPEETAELVARQLFELSILKLWVLVKCPSRSADEDGTIVETDSADVLSKTLSADCPHCGHEHTLTVGHLETAYSPNFPNESPLAPFDYKRALKGRSEVQVPRSDSNDRHFDRCRTLVGEEITGEATGDAILLLALRENAAIQAVPAPPEVWWHDWAGPIITMLAIPVVLMVLTAAVGRLMALVGAAAIVCIVWLTIRGRVQARLAPSAIQRTAFQNAFILSQLLMFAGAAGVELAVKDGEKLQIPWGESTITLPVKFSWGETNWGMVGVGVAVFAMSLAFVLIYDGKLGWFTSGKS